MSNICTCGSHCLLVSKPRIPISSLFHRLFSGNFVWHVRLPVASTCLQGSALGCQLCDIRYPQKDVSQNRGYVTLRSGEARWQDSFCMSTWLAHQSKKTLVFSQLVQRFWKLWILQRSKPSIRMCKMSIQTLTVVVVICQERGAYKDRWQDKKRAPWSPSFTWRHCWGWVTVVTMTNF